MDWIKSVLGTKKPNPLRVRRRSLVRVVGIEPTSQAWEARILPMYYTRSARNAAMIASCRTR